MFELLEVMYPKIDSYGTKVYTACIKSKSFLLDSDTFLSKSNEKIDYSLKKPLQPIIRSTRMQVKELFGTKMDVVE